MLLNELDDNRHDILDLGVWLRLERDRLNWSQSELAARAGCSRQYIAAIENGATHSDGKAINVRYDVVAAIGAALGMTDKIDIIKTASGIYRIRPKMPTVKASDTGGGEDVGTRQLLDAVVRLEQMVGALTRTVHRLEDKIDAIQKRGATISGKDQGPAAGTNDS